jgi:inosose dehydratase
MALTHLHLRPTRRDFLASASAAVLLGSSALAAEPGKRPGPKAARKPAHDETKRKEALKLGVASYSFRKFDLDKTLTMTRRAGIEHVCLKSFHLPLESTAAQIAAVAEKVAKADLDLYAVGVISMQKEPDVVRAFDYAKAAGAALIVAAPTAEMLPAIDAKVRAAGISVAIHNHGPGDKNFPTPQSVYEKIKSLDPRIGLCIDIGHTVRIGADLIASTENYADRLLDIHMKDVTEATPKGHEIQVGRGVIDIPRFLRTLVKIGYRGVVSFEYEGEADDPLPGFCESVGFTRGVLAAEAERQ